MALRTYTVHLPQLAVRGDARVLDGAKIVPDGFSWSAFAFTVLWFLYHRLWLAALLVLAFLVGTALGGRFLGLAPVAGAAISLLAAGLIGLEASSLRRWTYGRRGLPARDAVIAASADEAEAKAVGRWLDPAAAASSPSSASSFSGRRGSEPVIGLFPSSEGSR